MHGLQKILLLVTAILFTNYFVNFYQGHEVKYESNVSIDLMRIDSSLFSAQDISDAMIEARFKARSSRVKQVCQSISRPPGIIRDEDVLDTFKNSLFSFDYKIGYFWNQKAGSTTLMFYFAQLAKNPERYRKYLKNDRLHNHLHQDKRWTIIFFCHFGFK